MTSADESIIERLRSAYAAFNNRDADGVLVLMTQSVAWPRAFKGGYVEGPNAIREYWAEQWTEIDGTVEPISFAAHDDGTITVTVHQVVRDLDGNLLADQQVKHQFTFDDDLIARMEIVDSA